MHYLEHLLLYMCISIERLPFICNQTAPPSNNKKRGSNRPSLLDTVIGWLRLPLNVDLFPPNKGAVGPAGPPGLPGNSGLPGRDVSQTIPLMFKGCESVWGRGCCMLYCGWACVWFCVACLTPAITLSYVMWYRDHLEKMA